MFGKIIGWPCKIVQLPISNLEGRVTDERRNKDLKETDAAAVRRWSTSKFLFRRTQSQVNSFGP